LVLGVFIGSALWWGFLCCAVGFLRSRITPAWTRAVNRGSGCLLIAFGVYALCRVI